MTLSLRALLAALCLLGATLAGAQPAVPSLTARVTDLTGTLTPAQRAELETQLAAIEQRKGAQVAVLVVASTQPEPIEAYGLRVAEAWKLGRGKVEGRRVDDGVLLLVAKDDRRVRIEVGYGLEGAIPDALAKRIVAETIAPRFRAGDFFGGLQAAVADLARLIDGEALPQPWQPAHGAAQDDTGPDWLAGILVVLVAGMFATAVLGRLLGAAAGGAGAGVLALIKGASLWVAGVAALAAFVFFLVFVASGGRGLRPGRHRGGNGGPVIWTGGGGGWGGGASGGGFSGGGGGFGGGGASGDW